MIKDERPGLQNPTTTPQLPDSTPKVYPGSNYDFTLQAVVEMQRSLGKLENAIINLTDQSQKQGIKLDTISHRVSIAQGVAIAGTVILTALGSFIAFLLNKIIPLLQIKP